MASKGQKFASYSLEFKNEVLEAYKSGKYGGRDQVAKHYNISSSTIWNWISKDRKQGTLENDIYRKRGSVNVNLFCRFLVNLNRSFN